MLYVDCPSMITGVVDVIPASLSPQYNTIGELQCTNGGALFLNDAPISNETSCNVTAQWNIPININCYTGN